MQWEDEGIALGILPYGEHHGIAHVFTLQHGHARGLIYSRHKAALGAGALLDCRWSARLPEHLGTFSLEMRLNVPAALLPSPTHLLLVSSLCRLLFDSLPQGMPYEALYQRTQTFLQHAVGGTPLALLEAQYCWWEKHLLADLGYGLDLTECALTGATEDLCYVSPKTGRAASRAAARPYQEKLLPLPGFLRLDTAPDTRVTGAEVVQGLTLTEHFLRQFIYGPRDKPVPAIRRRVGESVAARKNSDKNSDKNSHETSDKD